VKTLCIKGLMCDGQTNKRAILYGHGGIALDLTLSDPNPDLKVTPVHGNSLRRRVCH